MDKIRFGSTKIEVSRLCFGTEPFTIPQGPLDQKFGGDLSPREGGQILKEALRLGVNFWDTSNDYGTHPHIAEGLRLVRRSDVIIADKSYAKTSKEATTDLTQSLRELDTDYIDIMLLHYIKNGELEQSLEALKTFCDLKENAVIRAVGLSTHSTKVVKTASTMPEIEVICTPLNKVGAWIDEGVLADHISAIEKTHQAGKAVYVIKLLDAGKLRNAAALSLRFAFQHHQFIHAFNIGMYNLDEVQMNLDILKNMM